MAGALLLVVMLAAVALTGWSVAASLPRTSAATSLLAIGLVGYAELVVVAFALSAVGALGRAGFVLGVLACLGSALAVWNVRGRPGGPLTGVVHELRQVIRDPSLLVLAGAVVIAAGYELVVALSTAQLDSDATDYHLPRVVLWLQQGGIGRIAGAADPRLSWAPPGAETVIAFTMAVARGDRYVALPQLAALPLAMVAVAGIARRIGFGRRPAVYSALVFGSLPIVFLQSATALNDLVLAATLLSALCCALGRTRADTAVCALAVALACITKLTALIALPLLVALVLAVAPRSARRALVAVLAGGAVGAAWYLSNLARTGSFDGGWAAFFDQTPDRSALDVTVRAQQYALDLFDASGFVGSDRWWLPIVGGCLMIGGLVLLTLRRTDRGVALALLGAGACAAALPWLVDAARWSVVRAFAHGLRLVGHGERIGELPVDPSTNASPVSSWYGLLFAALWLLSLVIVVVGVARRTASARLLALLAAPVAFAVLFSIATIDDGNRGRFFAFSVGVAAAAFGVVYPLRFVRMATPAVVIATVLVVIVHVEPRPLGLELLEPVRAPSVWGKDRFAAHDALAPQFDMQPSWVELERHLRDVGDLAVATRWGVNLYPLFGEGNRRRITLVRDPADVPDAIGTMIVTPFARAPSCSEGWARAYSPPNGFDVYVRAARDACDG